MQFFSKKFHCSLLSICIQNHKVHPKHFFFKTLHWLLISFSLHITRCAVEQFCRNVVYIANFGSVFPSKKGYEQLVCGCVPTTFSPTLFVVVHFSLHVTVHHPVRFFMDQ